MLYPTYLSSYRNLLKKDISPFSLMKVLVGDKPRSWIPKKPAVSPPEEAKPAEKPASQKITATTRRTAAKPITISDAHSRAVLRGTEELPPQMKVIAKETTAPRGVNPIIGGFGRSLFMLFMERGLQVMLFPMVGVLWVCEADSSLRQGLGLHDQPSHGGSGDVRRRSCRSVRLRRQASSRPQLSKASVSLLPSPHVKTEPF